MATINSINNKITSGDFTITLGDAVITAGNIEFPDTTSTPTGAILMNANRFLHGYGTTTVGSSNVFTGRDSGNFTLTTATATGNSGVGAQSLKGLTIGKNNSSLGVNSLFSCTEGDANVAIGAGALVLMTTGDNNVAIGRNSTGGNGVLRNLVTGSNNTAIGMDSGLSYTGAESNNVLLQNVGVIGEDNVMRLGTAGSGAGQVDTTYIAGPTMNIATDAVAGTVIIGNVTGATAVNINTGTGDFALASATGTIISALDTGEITQPLQPAFNAYNSVTDANVTGDGTGYTIIFDTVRFDQNSDYNNGTGVFTAPVTGRYMFSASTRLEELAAAHTIGIIQIVTSNLTYGFNEINIGGVRDGNNISSLSCSMLVDMDASDTCSIDVFVFNGALAVDVSGEAAATRYTTFSGYLVA